MHIYTHHVQYYETDKMGISHHSNYIRWMEEARVDFFDSLGCSYAELEKQGIYSPVVNIEARFKTPTTFSEAVQIQVSILSFNGVVLKLHYLMSKTTGEDVFEGSSSHCFLNNSGRPLRLSKSCPKLYDALLSFLRES